jgi:hypothetical protein
VSTHTSARRIAIASVFGVSLLLTACSGGGESDADAIQKYDPAEVQMLRDQAEQSNLELSDSLLLATLRSREDCRVMKTSIADLAAGKEDTESLTKLEALPQTTRDRGQNDQADYFQGMVDKVALGDPSTLQGYVDANCADVQ